MISLYLPVLHTISANVADRASMRGARLAFFAFLALLFCVAGRNASAQTAQFSGAQATIIGAVNIDATSPVVSMSFTFETPGTLGSISVLTQGAAGLDFANAGTGSCAAGSAYSAGQNCIVNVTFTPRFAGIRNGAVVLYDSSGNAIATGYLQGTGVGPQINYLPGTGTNLGGGFLNPWGVAVDSNGNLYVLDFYSGGVFEILAVNGKIPNSPEVRNLASSVSGRIGVAVNGAGNVYVADGQVVKELLAVNGSIPAEPTIVSISSPFNFNTGTGFNDLNGICVDGNGNLFVTDGNLSDGTYSQPSVYEILAVNGSIPTSPTIQTVYTGTLNPQGIAVDSSGNVYFADNITNAVYELLAVNGSIPASAAPISIATGFNGPSGIALDGNGNLYVADTGNAAVKKLLAVNGSLPANPVIKTVVSGFGQPSGLAVDEPAIYT